jgi:hypothetical protein
MSCEKRGFCFVAVFFGPKGKVINYQFNTNRSTPHIWISRLGRHKINRGGPPNLLSAGVGFRRANLVGGVTHPPDSLTKGVGVWFIQPKKKKKKTTKTEREPSNRQLSGNFVQQYVFLCIRTLIVIFNMAEALTLPTFSALTRPVVSMH